MALEHIRCLFGSAPKAVFETPTFIEPKSVERPFAPYYEEQIKPLITRFENDRIRTINAYRYCIYIGGFAAIAVGVLLELNGLAFQFYLGAGIVVAAVAMYLGNRILRGFNDKIKDEIFPLIVRFFGDDFRFIRATGISVSGYSRYGIIPDHNEEKAEDYISGSHKGVKFDFFESELVMESKSSDSYQRKVVFNGFIFICDVTKKFSGKTIVKRDSGIGLNWLKKLFQELEHVRLEDPEFEKKFEVYSSDQIEARYLLTVSFMRRLLDLARVFQAHRGLQCSFYNRRLLIMIPSDANRFEADSVFRPITFHKEIETVLADMVALFSIIDTLKLEDKTGL